MAEPSDFDRPLRLRYIFPLLFVGVYLTHLTLLRLPYYWDEAGYYIPAAYDFFRTGNVIPSSTLPNGHPPLPSLYLALWWKSGFAPAVTRVAMCVVTAIGLLGVYRLSTRLNSRPPVAVVTTLLTALYPVWFAQSTLAHADMFAAAATLWGLVFVFPRRNWPAAAACLVAAVWSKETAVVTPLALASWEFFLAFRNRKLEGSRSHLAGGMWMLLPAVTLVGWYAWFRHRTGFLFGNPQFFHYNVVSTLSPLRILLALAHRVLQLTAHMNMFVPVLCTCAALLLLPLRDEDGSERPRIAMENQAILYVVIAANVLFYSVLGGALLTRYMLPLYPLVLLLCVSTMYRRVRYWWGLALLSAIAFVIGLFVNPPYKFAPEDNLNYAEMIRLQQQGIRQVVMRFPGSTVLTAWPATDELTKPELGYVKKPVRVVAVDNFSLTEIQKAATSPDEFTAVFAFSTKYDPPHLWKNLGAGNEALDTRFFDFHRDLEPGAIAHLLGGKIVWREERDGQWATVLHLDRPQVAELR